MLSPLYGFQLIFMDQSFQPLLLSTFT